MKDIIFLLKIKYGNHIRFSAAMADLGWSPEPCNLRHSSVRADPFDWEFAS